MASLSYALMTALAVFLPASAAAQSLQPPIASRGVQQPGVNATEQLVNLVLVKSSIDTAVVRFGSGTIRMIRVGDLVGSTKVVIKEISPGRLVLEETFTGKDGQPNRALIVIKEGERGGTRYLQHADEPRFTGTRPVRVTPVTPDVVKPSPKKPGPM